MATDTQQIKTDLAVDKDIADKGIKQMHDMAEWLSQVTPVLFNWKEWVDVYDECPVESHQYYEGDHKALFARMMGMHPDLDVCVQAWSDFSVISGSSFCDCADLRIFHIGPHGNVHLNGTYKGHAVVAEINIPQRVSMGNKSDVLTLMHESSLNGMAVWVDGDLEFMYGYPNLGPNGFMPATLEPAGKE